MEAELIELLRFSDEAIGRYITFYLTGAAALTVLVMTEGYKKNFKPLGKIILMVCLGAVAYNNWANLVYYHQIYNATVDAIHAFAGGFLSQDSASMMELAGKDGALQHKPIILSHIGHIMGGIAMGSLIWWQEIQGVRDKIRIAMVNRKARRS